MPSIDLLTESDRLCVLRRYELLDTPSDPAFDKITRLAASLFNVPIALVSLIDADRQWLKSHHGVDVQETPRDIAFCAHTILQDHPLIVRDATADPRFAQNPLVSGPPHIRFYAGAPLITADGARLGSLCLVDTKPRPFSNAEEAMLTQLAGVVMTAVEAHRTQQRLLHENAVHEQTAVALRVVEARYQSIAENSPGLVFQFVRRTSGKAEFLFVSEASRAILGLEPAVLLADADAYFATVHPDDLQGRNRAVEESVRSLEALHWEGRHLLPSGEIKWVRISARPTRATDGDIFWDGVLLDVTSSKRDADRLRMLESSVEHANDAILITEAEPLDLPGPRIIYANRAFTKITGYTEAEVLGKTPRILQGPETNPETKRQIREALQRWQPVRVELINYRKDGTEFWEELSIVPVANASGWYTHWVSVQRDITERKRIEATLREAQARAEQAQAEAERANLAKSEFLSRMSHELRTPLSAILGFGQLLEMSSLDAEQRVNVSYILSGGRHLLGLINEVLDIARIEAGKLELELESVDVESAFNEVASLVRPLAQSREISLQVSMALQQRGPSSVLADEQRFRQILLNLVSNAIKYNQQAGSVFLDCESAGDDRLRMTVRDTGPGICPEDLPKLFAPFERLHARTSEVTGTGIGLAISRLLIEAMGGTITVDSVVGTGSTFSVELPRTTKPAFIHGRLSASEYSHMAPAAPKLEKRTVLYIEDNAPNIRLVQQVLSERSHIDLLTAVRGATGLEAARLHQPDLILLDAHLPDLTGEEVLQKLKEDPCTRDIAVVIVSADATAIQMKRLLAAGAEAYLTKPLELPSFLRKIDEMLEPRRPVSTG